MRAPFPAMPLWTDSYFDDTAQLSTIEHGALILLLLTMWRAGGALPDDDRRLARIARLGPQQWSRIKPTIMSFMVRKDGYLTNVKLLDTLAAVKRRSEAASNSARAKHLKNLAVGYANAERSDSVRSANLKLGSSTSPASRIAREKGLGKEEPLEPSPELVARLRVV